MTTDNLVDSIKAGTPVSLDAIEVQMTAELAIVDSIQTQLKDHHRTDETGRRLTWDEYQNWRRSALWALNAARGRHRILKTERDRLRRVMFGRIAEDQLAGLDMDDPRSLLLASRYVLRCWQERYKISPDTTEIGFVNAVESWIERHR